MRHGKHRHRVTDQVVAVVHSASFHRAEVVMVVLLALTVMGVVLAVTATKVWDLAVAVLLLAASIVWLLVDSPIEGAVLVKVSRGHGLTSGDLLALPAATLAVALVVRWFAKRLQRPVDAPSNA